MRNFIEQAHPQWRDILSCALDVMDRPYLDQLQSEANWLPGIQSIFKAFSMPLSKTNYILMGESPYPRQQSANGYAFWDNAVHSLWSPSGLSKDVNRATSLRNLIKMLLVARGDLSSDVSQAAIARLDKSNYLDSAEQLFAAFMHHGFLLLNASLVYIEGQVPYHARMWQPFLYRVLEALSASNSSIQLVLLGKIARQLQKATLRQALVAEHPYNISFITNKAVVEFFNPLNLLAKGSTT